MSGAAMHRLTEARWPEIEAMRRNVLVVPVGALEQHGPHLPLDTDACIAAHVAERAVAQRSDVGLVPVLHLGASGEHADFPGTVSIGTRVMRDVAVEVVRHAALSWRAVLFVNGHGGNLAALREAEEICTAEGQRLRVCHLALPGMDAHAGRAETSIMLQLAPERVRPELAEAGDTTPIERLLPRLRREGVRAVSPNGVLGDPTCASADEGRRLVAALVTEVVRSLDAVREA